MKTIISVECVDQDLIITNSPVIASGGLNENSVAFKFCSKWDGFAKTAVFYKNTKEVYHALIDENNMCEVPHEVTDSEGTMFFGVFGVSGDVTRTSRVLKYKIRQGAITGDTSPSDPTPDIYEQLLSQYAFIIEEHTDLQNAIEVAQSTADTATAIAKGRNQAHVFSTTADMAVWLSDAKNKGLWQRGDNIYIVELDVPDWWIAEVLNEADAQTGYYYKLGQLETQKIDLVNLEEDIANIQNTYQTKDKIFTTYKTLEALGTSVDDITTLTGLIPWQSQLNLCVTASMSETLFNKKIIPENVTGTLAVANYGARGHAMFITESLHFHYGFSNNADTTDFTWVDNTLNDFIVQINRDYYGTDGWNGPAMFDLMPNGEPSAQLSTLGMCYFSNTTDIAKYHGPELATSAYVHAFGMNTYRYAMLAIERGYNRVYVRTDGAKWSRIDPHGDVVWKNTDIASGTEWGSVDIDTSLYTHFEVLYAESLINSTGKPYGLRTTGKLPINSGCEDFALVGRNSVEIFDTHRDCSIDSNGNLVWQNCVYYDSEYNETSDSKKCVPLKVIAY